MTNGRIKKIIALFMSLVFSFGILSSDVISIKGYAETDFNQIAHDQNLQEANLEGEEESRIQGNVSHQ